MKHDNGKVQLSLVPTRIIEAIARIRMYGSEIYEDPDNWKEVEKKRFVDAGYRHWLAYIRGEELDKDSGLPHIWHAACNLAFIIEMETLPEKEDDWKQRLIKITRRDT